MSELIAVLGLGSIGMRHLRNLLGSGCRVVGFDPDSKRTEAALEAGATIAGTREAAVGQARAVVIASPNACHLDDLAAVLGAHRHAFVEKPLAHTVSGLDVLLRSARESKLVVFAGFNLRFHPAVRAARALLDDNRLGDVLWARFIASSFLPDWRKNSDYRGGYTADPVTGGVLFDLIHDFDLAAHLVGAPQTLAAAARRTGALEIDAEDCADVILRHEGGVISSLHLDYVTRPAERVAEIAGTKGVLRLDLRARTLCLRDTMGDIATETAFGGSPDDDYIALMGNFLASIEGRESPACDGQEALLVLEQVIAARRLSGLPGT